jgi:hypothetical protein
MQSIFNPDMYIFKTIVHIKGLCNVHTAAQIKNLEHWQCLYSLPVHFHSYLVKMSGGKKKVNEINAIKKYEQLFSLFSYKTTFFLLLRIAKIEFLK